MTAQAVILFLVGALQPYAEEFLFRTHISGLTAHLVTIAFSSVLALVAVWVTGGFAGDQVPLFSLADPSPLLGFLVAKLAPVYALSQIVYQAFSTNIKKLAGTF